MLLLCEFNRTLDFMIKSMSLLHPFFLRKQIYLRIDAYHPVLPSSPYLLTLPFVNQNVHPLDDDKSLTFHHPWSEPLI